MGNNNVSKYKSLLGFYAKGKSAEENWKRRRTPPTPIFSYYVSLSEKQGGAKTGQGSFPSAPGRPGRDGLHEALAASEAVQSKESSISSFEQRAVASRGAELGAKVSDAFAAFAEEDF